MSISFWKKLFVDSFLLKSSKLVLNMQKIWSRRSAITGSLISKTVLVQNYNDFYMKLCGFLFLTSHLILFLYCYFVSWDVIEDLVNLERKIETIKFDPLAGYEHLNPAKVEIPTVKNDKLIASLIFVVGAISLILIFGNNGANIDYLETIFSKPSITDNFCRDCSKK